MLNIIIIDDSEKQLNYIEKSILSLYGQDVDIQKFQDENEFLNNIHIIPAYSIFFVDIVLNEKNGIDIAKQINAQVRGAIIIFISSYLDKVVDIYDAHHYYFIYKSELEKRLPIALKKAIGSLEEIKKTLPLDLKGKTILVHPANIFYLERQKRTTVINENNQEIVCNEKLDIFLDKLPSYFIRCHRSFIINMQLIKEMKRSECILNNGAVIPISRAYQKKVQEEFQKFLMGNI